MKLKDMTFDQLIEMFEHASYKISSEPKYAKLHTYVANLVKWYLKTHYRYKVEW